MKNKIVAILLCVALCFSFCSVAFGCDKEPEEVQKDKLMLFLGDSICEGILGPSPLIERENYSYYALVGRRTDGYYYRNRSVSGHQTSNFRAYLTENTDENAMLTQTYIKEADIIAVSIIGNDVLQNQFDEMFIQAIEGSYEILDQRLSDARDNIDAVIKYIKQQNPNVTLIFQTLYNPVYSTTPLVREELRKTLKNYGVGAKNLRRLADLVIERMNDVLRDYLVENPGAYYLMDVNGKFDEYFDQDEELGASLIYPDGTHPSNIGHAVIADMYQEYLESTKNTDHDYAIQVYKEIKNEQIERMFANSLDVAAAKEQINACTSCKEITEKYFELIDGETADYSNTFSSLYVPESEKEYFKETRNYKIKSLSVVNFLVGGFLTSNSGMTFNTDGTFDIELVLNSSLISIVNSTLLSSVDFSTVDLEYWADLYAVPLFPAFTIDNAFGTLSEMGSVCVYVNGFELEKPEIAAINDYIANTGMLPDDFLLPNDLSISIRGKYSVHTLHSDYSGDHTAVFLGDYTEKGEPLFVLTNEVDENGVETMLLQFFVLNLQILGSRKD